MKTIKRIHLPDSPEDLLPELPEGGYAGFRFELDDGSVIDCEDVASSVRKDGMTEWKVRWNGLNVRKIRLELPPLCYTGDDELVLPLKTVARIMDPAKRLFAEFHSYSTEWKDRVMEIHESGIVPAQEAEKDHIIFGGCGSMQFLHYGKKDGASLWLASCDSEFDNTEFEISVEKGDPYLRIAMIKELNRSIPAGEKCFAVGFHENGWRGSARLYRAWFDSAGLKVRKSKAFFPGIVCQYDFQWQDGHIVHRYADLERISLEAMKYGMDTMLCAGWNRGGFDVDYPDFSINPSLGTLDELKEQVKRIHHNGGKILFYVNAFSWDMLASDFEERGRRNAVQIRPGVIYTAGWGSHKLAGMCTASSEWRGIVMKNVGFVIECLGADGVYLDQLSVQPPVCCAQEHEHAYSRVRQNMELMAEIRRRFGEDKLYISEWAVDAMTTQLDAQLADTLWRNRETAFPELFRYVFPEAGMLDMLRFKPWPGKDPSVEMRFFRDILERMFLMGIRMWCYRHSLDTPGFEDLIQLAIQIQNKHSEAFLNGIYRDMDGLMPTPDGLEVRRFDLPHAVMLTAANRTGQLQHVILNGKKIQISAEPLSVVFAENN